MVAKANTFATYWLKVKTERRLNVFIKRLCPTRIIMPYNFAISAQGDWLLLMFFNQTLCS